jgi:ribosomal protein S12 methylthiotransferase accessory factor
MYGEELLKEASMTLQNNNRFPGLIPTDENLKGLDKHLALIESYRKLHSKRANP